MRYSISYIIIIFVIIIISSFSIIQLLPAFRRASLLGIGDWLLLGTVDWGLDTGWVADDWGRLEAIWHGAFWCAVGASWSAVWPFWGRLEML